MAKYHVKVAGVGPVEFDIKARDHEEAVEKAANKWGLDIEPEITITGLVRSETPKEGEVVGYTG